jgi:protein TonB
MAPDFPTCTMIQLPTRDVTRPQLAAVRAVAIEALARAARRRAGVAAAGHARLARAPFGVAVLASVLLHFGVLGGLLPLHHAVLPSPDPAPIDVTLTAEDPAVRLGTRAGVAWDTPADDDAVTALLGSRRGAALMGELVLAPPRRTPPPMRAAVATVVQGADQANRPRTESAADAAPTAPSSARSPAPAAARPVAPTPRVETPATGQPAPAGLAPAEARGGPAATEAGDPSYLDAVFERLNRLKDYPGLAKYHASGRVLVAFTVARDGTVLNAEVRRSSGYSFLDKAGLDLIHRASPLPALPANLSKESLAILIPISFWYD